MPRVPPLFLPRMSPCSSSELPFQLQSRLDFAHVIVTVDADPSVRSSSAFVAVSSFSESWCVLLISLPRSDIVIIDDDCCCCCQRCWSRRRFDRYVKTFAGCGFLSCLFPIFVTRTHRGQVIYFPACLLLSIKEVSFVVTVSTVFRHIRPGFLHGML